MLEQALGVEEWCRGRGGAAKRSLKGEGELISCETDSSSSSLEIVMWFSVVSHSQVEFIHTWFHYSVCVALERL